MHAYKHGIVFLCPDGVERRFYPRFFTYTADYPEKWVHYGVSCLKCLTRCNRVILAGIRNLGRCPCPRCTMPLQEVHLMGTDTDMSQRIELARIDGDAQRETIAKARGLILENGVAINSVLVENLLKEHSLVPTEVSSLRATVLCPIEHNSDTSTLECILDNSGTSSF